MAEGLLRHRLDSLGIEARIRSAGVLDTGSPAAPEAVAALRARGIDISSHRSQRLSGPLVAGADLVLGMARQHVREVALIDPAAWPHSFTLKELVRRGELAGPWARGQSLDEWLAKVAADRTHAEMLGSSHADDVADPIGGPPSGFEATAAELSELVAALVALLRAGAW
jgi:protein-tyrosine phosphatase